MSESQPDMLGGKAVSASRLARIRKCSKPPVARQGHAAPMGSGPAGETCGGCTYCEVFHYRKTYYKCRAREGDHWKGGRKTDIRPLDPACSKFEPQANNFKSQKVAIHEAVSVSSDDARFAGHSGREEATERPRGRDDGRGGPRASEKLPPRAASKIDRRDMPGQMNMFDIMGDEEP